MLNINMNVRDVALNISRDFTVSIDDQLRVSDLAAMLVKKLAWPEKDINGQQIEYVLQIERNNGKIHLTGREMIRDAGLLNGDRLIIGPNFGRPAALAPSASTVPTTTQE